MKIKLPSIKLRLAVEDYFEKNHIPLGASLRTDVILALVRMNTPEARSAAEQLLGKKITTYPAAVPPWPPKPVSKPKIQKVSIVRERTYNRKGKWAMPKKTQEKFSMVRPGMTREQLVARGVPSRDLSRWTKSGNIVWSIA